MSAYTPIPSSANGQPSHGPTAGLVALARDLMAELDAKDVNDCGGILETWRRLDDVLRRIAADDPSMAEELAHDLDTIAGEPAAQWGPETDAFRWELNQPEPEPPVDFVRQVLSELDAEDEQTLTLAGWVQGEANRYRMMETQAADSDRTGD